MSVAQSILEIAIARARAEGATRIENIRVAVGALTTYVDDSLRFYWDSMTEGTLAEGSTIEFTRIEGRVRCLSCRHEYATDDSDLRCPRCNGLWTLSLTGNECYVDSIDVYEEELACR
jgi:hydrogenase nickel incorporation protein HypA/HybF